MSIREGLDLAPHADHRIAVTGAVSEAKDPPHDERFYPVRIVGVGRGGYTAKKLGAFDPRGFSGGPVINSAGLVVGNVLVGSDFTTVAELAAAGVRRISTGGALARAAWTGFIAAASEIADDGTF